MDELFEALTLIQTGKIRGFPVVLVGSAYWKGLIDWLKATVLSHGSISPEDIDLIHIVDDPEEVSDIILRRYRDRTSAVPQDRRDRSRRGI